MASTRPITTCVLGVGLSGLTFHIPFILALPSLFKLSAVLERTPSSPGGKVKERFGADVTIYSTLEQVLADNDIELVVVGTPNATHYEYVKRCLQAGKHVLVEKPIVPTLAEGLELKELASSKNLTLYVYQNRRWDADFLALRRLLREPSTSSAHLGEILEFESHYDRYQTKLKGTWKDENLPGAGQVYNLGSHLIDQAVTLFGRPDTVTGMVENVRGIGDPEIDDSFTIILRYARSTERKRSLNVFLRAHILSARDPQLRFVVRGTKGTFVKHGLDLQESQMQLASQPDEIFSDNFGREPESIWGEIEVMDENGNFSRSKWPSVDNGAYVNLFYDLADTIRKGKEPEIRWNEILTVLEIMELVHQSSKEGRSIRLS